MIVPARRKIHASGTADRRWPRRFSVRILLVFPMWATNRKIIPSSPRRWGSIDVAANDAGFPHVRERRTLWSRRHIVMRVDDNCLAVNLDGLFPELLIARCGRRRLLGGDGDCEHTEQTEGHNRQDFLQMHRVPFRKEMLRIKTAP